MQDSEDKPTEGAPASNGRRLSRSKTGVLLVDPVDVVVKPAEGHSAPVKRAEVGGGAESVVVYGGGVPGVALDADSVELQQYTGVRDGGYEVRSGPAAFGPSCC